MKSPVLAPKMSFKKVPFKPSNLKSSMKKTSFIRNKQQEIVYKDVARGGEKCGGGAVLNQDMRPVTVESVMEFEKPKIICTSDTPDPILQRAPSRAGDVSVINNAWEQKKSGMKPREKSAISRTGSIVVKVKPVNGTVKRQTSSRQSECKVRTEDIPVGQRYEDYFKFKESEEDEYGVKPRWVGPRMKYYVRK